VRLLVTLFAANRPGAFGSAATLTGVIVPRPSCTYGVVHVELSSDSEQTVSTENLKVYTHNFFFRIRTKNILFHTFMQNAKHGPERSSHEYVRICFSKNDCHHPK
jgi:hypothetical protein